MNKYVAYSLAFSISAAISGGICLAMGGRLGDEVLKSVLIGGGVGAVFIGTAAHGSQLEEETDRRVEMSRKARTVWFAIGVVLVLALGFLGPIFLGGSSDSMP